jgi:TetR/AcrR family transcriptional regulator, regulator of cefoperazone and chloramphenicol sensitivity
MAARFSESSPTSLLRVFIEVAAIVPSLQGRRLRRAKATQLRKTNATRQILLETAGEVFSAVGFDGASGRDICERAGVNPAAINYYFGGLERLYTAVVEEAHKRLVDLGSVLDLVNSAARVEEQLIQLFQLLLRTALSNSDRAWPIKVLTRESLNQSPYLDALRESDLVPKLRVIRQLISEFMDLPEDCPAVTNACLMYVSASVMFHMADRQAIQKAFPSARLGDPPDDLIVTHFTEFMLGGMQRLARLSKAGEPE